MLCDVVVCVCVWASGFNWFARFVWELLCAAVWRVLSVAFVCVVYVCAYSARDGLCDVVWLV